MSYFGMLSKDYILDLFLLKSLEFEIYFSLLGLYLRDYFLPSSPEEGLRIAD